MTEMTRPPLQIRISRKVLLCSLAILFGFSVASLPQYLRIKKSAEWPSVPGVITASWMRSGICKGMPCYHGEIVYHYRVGNIEYSGTAFELGRTHWAAREAWQKDLDRYPIGKVVSVYYEPRNPPNAVLEPGLFGETEIVYKMDVGMIWFFGLCFVAALLWYHDPEVSVAELSASSRKKL
jgi:hypothetical protein